MMLALTITAYRKQAKLSVRQLAKIIGVQHTALWRFEKGEQIELDNVARICRWIFGEPNK